MLKPILNRPPFFGAEARAVAANIAGDIAAVKPKQFSPPFDICPCTRLTFNQLIFYFINVYSDLKTCQCLTAFEMSFQHLFKDTQEILTQYELNICGFVAARY